MRPGEMAKRRMRRENNTMDLEETRRWRIQAEAQEVYEDMSTSSQQGTDSIGRTEQEVRDEAASHLIYASTTKLDIPYSDEDCNFRRKKRVSKSKRRPHRLPPHRAYWQKDMEMIPEIKQVYDKPYEYGLPMLKRVVAEGRPHDTLANIPLSWNRQPSPQAGLLGKNVLPKLTLLPKNHIKYIDLISDIEFVVGQPLASLCIYSSQNPRGSNLQVDFSEHINQIIAEASRSKSSNEKPVAIEDIILTTSSEMQSFKESVLEEMEEMARDSYDDHYKKRFRGRIKSLTEKYDVLADRNAELLAENAQLKGYGHGIVNDLFEGDSRFIQSHRSYVDAGDDRDKYSYQRSETAQYPPGSPHNRFARSPAEQSTTNPATRSQLEETEANQDTFVTTYPDPYRAPGVSSEHCNLVYKPIISPPVRPNLATAQSAAQSRYREFAQEKICAPQLKQQYEKPTSRLNQRNLEDRCNKEADKNDSRRDSPQEQAGIRKKKRMRMENEVSPDILLNRTSGPNRSRDPEAADPVVEHMNRREVLERDGESYGTAGLWSPAEEDDQDLRTEVQDNGLTRIEPDEDEDEEACY